MYFRAQSSRSPGEKQQSWDLNPDLVATVSALGNVPPAPFLAHTPPSTWRRSSAGLLLGLAGRSPEAHALTKGAEHTAGTWTHSLVWLQTCRQRGRPSRALEMGGRVGMGCLSGRPLPQTLTAGTHQSLTLISGRVVSISSSQYPSALRSTTWDLRQVLGVGGGWEGLGLTTRALGG